MNDPLAQFRKKQPTREQSPPTDQGPEDYLAFGTKDRVERLRVRRAAAPTRSPGYAYLLDISYDGPFGTNFVLAYTFLMVLVRGKNLQQVVTALELGTCDFIQEYDPDRWAKPSDATAAFIESIEVVVKESGDGVEEAEKVSMTRKPH
ncbi:MAG: hypothetical protein HY299_02720 [Verrucomicrobia bacterium]|nr:hypothetical protein [Verrucomicrobiota bacterium]